MVKNKKYVSFIISIVLFFELLFANVSNMNIILAKTNADVKQSTVNSVNLCSENIAYKSTVGEPIYNKDGSVTVELSKEYGGLGVCFYLNNTHSDIKLSDYKKLVIEYTVDRDYPMSLELKAGDIKNDYWNNGSTRVGDVNYSKFNSDGKWEKDISGLNENAKAILINFNSYGGIDYNANITIKSIKLYSSSIDMKNMNVASDAIASAEYTNVYGGISTDAINDGQLANSDVTASWNCWGAENNGADYPMWVQLTWNKTYELTGTAVLWWSDGADNGVQFPSGCSVEYLAVDETWKKIDAIGVKYTTDGYNGANTIWNELTFEKAITTTALRLIIEKPNTENAFEGVGVGISEWEVYGHSFDTMGNKLECSSSCAIKEGNKIPLRVFAYADSLDELKFLTDGVVWKSENPRIATVKNIGFFLPVSTTKYSTEKGVFETWKANGLIYVNGISEGSTTIIGTTVEGDKVTCKVTVAENDDANGVPGSGGSLILGENASGQDFNASEFFPSNWSLKLCMFPIEISKEEKKDGSYVIKGSVGIGKSDWLDNDSKWNKYKKNVSDAKKYSKRFDCLNAYKDTWKVKSITAVSTDKFEILPTLSVMGYFENTYDKNGNIVSQEGKLAADTKWEGSINWQFITPIGPLYLNLIGSGEISCDIEPQYDYVHKSMKITDGSLKLIPSVTLEGGYGIDKIATVGAQGTLSVPITIIPASKGEFEATAALHVKLIFVLDYTQNLATYKTTIWDNIPSKTKNIRNSNILKLSKGKISEMDVSFDEASGKWNGGNSNKGLNKLGRRILDTMVDNTTTLQEGILPSSLPMQVRINNKSVMVFQAYDNSRTTLNSTVLKYSVLENGVWSEPKTVLDDGYADMFFDMKIIDNKLVLVWQKICNDITGDVENDSKNVLKSMAESSEVYFSVFDENTNTFINPVRVTNNNQCDMMPRICSDSDEIIVSWVRNNAADLMQETGNNEIYTAKWNGSSFEKEASLLQAVGTIDNYVVYQNEESIQSIYTGQANGITAVFETDGQILPALSEIVSASYDNKISSLDYSAGNVSFTTNGKLYSYDIYSENLDFGMAGETVFASEVKYCSNGEKSGYIWSVYDEDTDRGSILASMKTETGYSEPITICEKEHIIWRYLSPIIDSEGNWHIVANALDTQTDLNSLLYVTKESKSNLKLINAFVDENDVLNGFTGVDYLVTNTEDNVVDSINIIVTLADGSKITKTIQETILPRESKAGTVYMDLRDVLNVQEINLSIYAENQTDISDNVIKVHTGHPDVSIDAISSETSDEISITATLENISLVDANTTLYLYGNEEMSKELQKQEGIILKANENKQIQFTLKKKDITYNENNAAYLTLYASNNEGDYNEDNNVTYIMLYHSDAPQATSTPTPEPTAIPTDIPKEVEMPHATDMPVITDKPDNSVFVHEKQQYAIGQTVRDVNGVLYKITSSDSVEYVKPVNRSVTKVTIPTDVSLSGKIYKVTSISNRAFNGCIKLKTVIIGKNIVLIGKKAFANCKKLKKITIKTKLLKFKSVGSRAFRGIYIKPTVKLPKKQRKIYKKILEAKGIPKAVKYK